jgi:molybdopterin molybdotransferase
MKLLSYETSVNMLNLLTINSTRSENVALSSSLGRTLAIDIVAEFNDPQFPTASMDGYAIRHEDLNLDSISILGDNPAGHDEVRKIKSGECIKTFTGSMMPSGADTLIQIENVSVSENSDKIYIDEYVYNKLHCSGLTLSILEAIGDALKSCTYAQSSREGVILAKACNS